jgi:serine/threonine protein kinase
MDADDFKLHDAHVLLTDFGESYCPSSETRRGEDCHTPLAARPPEVRFEPQAPLSYPADIWSLAVAIWAILGMKALFSNEYVTEDEIVSQHIDVLGPMPTSWWKRWEKRGGFFDQDGRPTEGREVWRELEESFEYGVQHYRRKLEKGVFGEEETRAILNLIRQMLKFQPEERLTIQQVLESEWMVKWVLPDLESCRNSK